MKLTIEISAEEFAINGGIVQAWLQSLKETMDPIIEGLYAFSETMAKGTQNG